MSPVKGINFNINSMEMRRRIAKGLVASYDKVEGTWVDWERVLSDVSWRAIKYHRTGNSPEEIWPSEDDTLEVDYLLKPLLCLDHPSIIFGDYGSLKSMIALVSAYVVQLPYHDNNLGLVTKTEPTRCLYLDYEDIGSSFRKRWSALDRGFGKGAAPILYKHMTLPLADSVEQVSNIISESKVKMIIVDSLGPAARGNLNDSEPAIKYHAALRHLGCTSLTLAHTSKDQFTRKKSIFGSVFFTNLARSVWESKTEQEVEEGEVIVSLKQIKANLSGLHPPLGYKFMFTNNSIAVNRADLMETSLSGELSLSTRVKGLLRGGAMSAKDIAETLDTNEASTRTILNRLLKKGHLVKVGDSWGLSFEV